MAENVPNLKKDTDIQKQEAQRFPSKMTQNRPMSGHIVIKMAKVKDKRILKVARVRQRVTFKRTSIRLSADYLQ